MSFGRRREEEAVVEVEEGVLREEDATRRAINSSNFLSLCVGVRGCEI